MAVLVFEADAVDAVDTAAVEAAPLTDPLTPTPLMEGGSVDDVDEAATSVVGQPRAVEPTWNAVKKNPCTVESQKPAKRHNNNKGTDSLVMVE